MPSLFGCIESTLSLYLIGYRFEAKRPLPSKLPLHRTRLRAQCALRILASTQLSSLVPSFHQCLFPDLTDPKELEEVPISALFNPSFTLSATVSLTAVIAPPPSPHFSSSRCSVWNAITLFTTRRLRPLPTPKSCRNTPYFGTPIWQPIRWRRPLRWRVGHFAGATTYTG